MGAHGAPNTAPACATTPMLADLGVLYGGRGRLLRVAEVADQLGVSTATVYGLCAAGELPHVRIVDSIRVRPSDLAAFVKRATRRGPDVAPARAATSTVAVVTPMGVAKVICRQLSSDENAIHLLSGDQLAWVGLRFRSSKINQRLVPSTLDSTRPL